MYAIYCSEMSGGLEFIELICTYDLEKHAREITALMNDSFKTPSLEFFYEKCSKPLHNIGFHELQRIFKARLTDEILADFDYNERYCYICFIDYKGV